METICHINKRHAKINEDLQYLCSECCKPFEKIPTLMTHVRVDHFQFQPYKCQHCELLWDTEWKLNNHMKELLFNSNLDHTFYLETATKRVLIYCRYI